MVGRPETTVRSFRESAEVLARVLLARTVSWGWSGWELPSSPLPRYLAAVGAVAGAVAARSSESTSQNEHLFGGGCRGHFSSSHRTRPTAAART